MRLRPVATAVVVAALLVAGCTAVVDGSGHNAAGPVPGSPGGPVPGSPAPGGSAVKATDCPHVEYPAAKLSFDCITSGMTARYNGFVWPLSEFKTVEKPTATFSGWVLEEGAGHWGSPGATSLRDIAANVRDQMVASDGYGANPRMHIDADRDMSVDGRPAHLLQTTFTLDPVWARTDGTKVKHEKLWIVDVAVSPGDVSLWYASVPDLSAALWPKVAATIAAIKVG
jgi:hypothetical protein